MRVLIIGGTGNISTAIAKMLIEKGEEVILYNRGNSEIEGARKIVGDRRKYEDFENQMQDTEYFDCVIDMIGYSPEDEESAVRVFKGKIGHFIFCSTVDIFRKPSAKYPIKEGYERGADPDFRYAYNKVLCEETLEQAHGRGDFPVTIIRPAATYNDTQCPISLLGTGTTLLKRIREGRPIIVLGDGTSFWVSSHRDDVARAFVGAVGNPLAYGKSYNVTGDEFITWEEYYSTVARVMDAPPVKFVHISTELLGRLAPKSAEWCRLNFKFNNIFDNTLAKQELNYKYTISWEEGVRRMVQYHDQRAEIDSATDYPLYDLIIEKYNKMCDKLVGEVAYFDK
jgi:nucleoside-diphosphate-sugar epimerase